MNYLKRTIKDLNELPAQRQALENIPERIKILEMRFEAIRAARTDGDPVSGGTNRREDMLLDNIAERQELEADLEATIRKVELMEKALASMTKTEQKVLERFYINREKSAADRLQEELGYSQSQIYRIKEESLTELTRRLRGQVKL